MKRHRERVTVSDLGAGNQNRRLPAVIACAVACCCLDAVGAASAGDQILEAKRAAEIGLQPGMQLDQKTAALAEGLLPPEMLRHYRSGEYQNEIADWPLGKGTLGPEFEAQTQKNRETLTVNDLGGIISRQSGKQPPYIFGVPFPDVQAGDPQAAVKIVWNMYYGMWVNGNTHSVVDLVWLRPDGVDRQAGQDVYFKMYDALPPAARSGENPRNLLVQFIAISTKPADLYGTTALAWRYRDSEKRDSAWAYVPALRRVRGISPANRSDGFLGSDMSQDDGQFFDGKPEDFSWTVVGEQETLRLVDPALVTQPRPSVRAPGGGWRPVFTEDPTYGFERPNWSGAAWAPILMRLARRSVWIVEGVPRDRYYLYGKIQLWIDKENWQGAYNRKFSWQGELLNCGQVRGGPAGKYTEEYYTWQGPGNAGITQIAENVKMNRATVAAVGPGSRAVQDWFVSLDAEFFDYQTLYRFGK